LVSAFTLGLIKNGIRLLVQCRLVFSKRGRLDEDPFAADCDHFGCRLRFLSNIITARNNLRAVSG
jgi:hypothetical protein